MGGRLQGKIALVTGGASGIGYAITRAYLNEGARVGICGRNAERLEEAARSLGAGDNLKTIQCDLRTMDGCRAAVEGTAAAFGGLDILVNNAGVFWQDKIENVTEDFWQGLVDTNLKAPYFLTQMALPYMRQKRKGKVIFITSIAGLAAFPDASVYCLTKAGLEGLTRALASELGPDGIRVNTLAPGNVVTPLNQHLMVKPEHRRWMAERTPIEGRPAQPEEMAGAAVFLASDESDFVTGTTLLVDGGWIAHK